MLKWFDRADFLLKETLLGLARGGWMNWAAIGTVTVLLFLFGAGLQVSWQMDNLLGQMGSQLEISVYLDPDTDVQAMQARLLLVEGVRAVRHVPKDAAWAELLQDLGQSDAATATEQLGSNPLLDEFKVQAFEANRVPDVAQRIAGLKGVADVWYVSEAIARLGELKTAIGRSSAIVTSVFTGVAVVAIVTTLRLIVVARQQEIEIMQLVGATLSWIYLPFILQGLLFGVVGAAIAYVLLAVGLGLIGGAIVNQPALIESLAGGLLTDWRVRYLLPLVLVVFGAAVGGLGSMLAVRRITLNGIET